MIRDRGRRVLAGAVRGWWEGRGGTAGAAITFLLRPAGALFGGVVRLRNAGYDRGWWKSHRATIPVVSVGNLSVGGTGKTPITAWLAVRIGEMGGRPAIISRGYGRDELALHSAWNPDVPVHRAPDRMDGIRRAAADGATIALLDDGFQHRRAGRDLDLVLVAVEQPFPPRLLPGGPFREPASSLRRADMVVLTRKNASGEDADALEREIVRRHPGVGIARIQLRADRWERLEGGEIEPPAGDVLAVSSIAEPGSFHSLLRDAVDGAVEGIALPDHHEYTAGDVDRMEAAARGRTIVTTEKDAVKLRALAPRLPDVRVLHLRVHVERGEDALRGALEAVLRRSAGGTS